MKPIVFLGNSLKALRDFPKDVRYDAGRQLQLVQQGRRASDCKPVPTVGKGVEEIRIWQQSGTYRVIYAARFTEAVYVLHAFQKKSQATPKREVEIARERYQQIVRGRK